MKKKFNIGTSSWKYDSWQGLIYPEKRPFNYLEEYSKHYNCVEVDQWFWSLFAGDKVALPRPDVVKVLNVNYFVRFATIILSAFLHYSGKSKVALIAQSEILATHFSLSPWLIITVIYTGITVCLNYINTYLQRKDALIVL